MPTPPAPSGAGSRRVHQQSDDGQQKPSSLLTIDTQQSGLILKRKATPVNNLIVTLYSAVIGSPIKERWAGVGQAFDIC